MEREAAVKLMRALVDAGYIADDQRADAAIEKVALEAGLNREQLKAALKYAREQKWVAETIKRRGASSLKPGLTPRTRNSSVGRASGNSVMMCASGSTRQVVGVNQHRSLKGCLKRLLGTFGCALSTSRVPPADSARAAPALGQRPFGQDDGLHGYHYRFAVGRISGSHARGRD